MTLRSHLILRVLCVAVLAGGAAAATTPTYRHAPRDINMEGKYRTFARLCFVGKMPEAEVKARDVLDAGYRGTRYECWVHDKLADGYEKQGNIPRAIQEWQQSMLCSDPRMGSHGDARQKILLYGGALPVAPDTQTPAPAAASAPRASPSPPAFRPQADQPRTAFTPSPASRPQESSAQPRAPQAWVPLPQAPVPPRPATAASPLHRDPGYQSALAELHSGTYQGLRAAAKKLESLVLDHGYQGTPAEAELQLHIAECHLELARIHYDWANAAVPGSEAAATARQRSRQLDALPANAPMLSAASR